MIPYTKNVSLKLRKIGFEKVDTTRASYVFENIECFRTNYFLVRIKHLEKIISVEFFAWDDTIKLKNINSISQLKKIMEIFNS